MNTEIKIKKEKIDPAYDSQDSLSNILPMPLILPKEERTNDYTVESGLVPHSSVNIKIKSEPKDYSENINTSDNPVVPLPLPLIVKKEKLNDIHSSLIDNLLDDLVNDGENETNNVRLGQHNSNIEAGEIIETDDEFVNRNVDIKIEPHEKEIPVVKKKHKKHKKRKISELIELNVAKEIITAKRNLNVSDNNDDNSRSKSPTQEFYKKKRREEKHQSLSSSSDAMTVPLVRDYNHKSIAQNNPSDVITLPKPKIVKIEPNLLLPKPILQTDQNEDIKRNFKKIKLEKQCDINPSHSQFNTVLKRCKTIINNMEVHGKSKYSTRIFYTPINFIPPINSSNIENRSPLLCNKNVQYKFSSTSKINYEEFGIISPHETVTKLCRIIGFETGPLMDLITSKPNSSNLKSENNVKKSFLTNSTFSSFYTNASTQTDQLPCDKCIIRQLSKRHNISVQAVADINEIAVQTDQEDELPMIKEFHTLNMNQQLALNDFYSIIISGQPTNANEKLKIRDRLVQIFDMANQQVMNTAPLIIPPAPLLPSNPYNSGLPHSVLGYPGPTPSNSEQIPYYQHSQQMMLLNNYQQQMLLNSHQMPRSKVNDPRNKPSDPRSNGNNSRHNYDYYSR